MVNLVDKVSLHCVKNHMSKKEFAESVDMSYAQLWAKLTGRREFRLLEAYRVARALNIDVVEFCRLLFSTS